MRPTPVTRAVILFALAIVATPVTPAAAGTEACILPSDSLGDFRWERQGYHDAANIRTEFWNFGMVGNFPRDALGVDLTTFHSAEVPKGTGMNYTDGITPFVLAKVKTTEGLDAWIMETGYRERQAISASRPGELQMRFEPRRGYSQEDPNINRGRSPAVSNDPRTWPNQWADKDTSWNGDWNGYFGKRAAADQESFFVFDDQYYDAVDFYPDSTCRERRGLGLKIEARGFQWANPQAGNVIFWHYDITNEGTTTYDDNIVFGLYMDSGVGGSAVSCDGIAESDDDNAFFDKSLGLNLVYTWDKGGRGVDLAGTCSPTGYLGYAYLETPGNPFDGRDNDTDGILDEKRDAGPGERIVGKEAIRARITADYDFALFEAFYGPLENRPAYKVGTWWTGDEDMDWVAEFNDVGNDGVFGSADPVADGERDGIPTEGEPNFDKTDINESDQIGLTGFKMNRIKVGKDNPSSAVDDILFFTNDKRWPQTLYEQFTAADSAARFGSAVALNYNIGFLFASGPFRLEPGRRERFSLALAYGADLSELRTNVRVVQQIYDANYQFAIPPPRPTLAAEAGDGYVKLTWDDVAERGFDPVSGLNDFEGYRVYRSTDPDFNDVRVLTTGRGNPAPNLGKPIAQFDLRNSQRGYSRVAVQGVQYWLGDDTGITHTWTDTSVTNGQVYYYAVVAYDYGSPASVPDSIAFFPSENSFPVSRTVRGGLILPPNVVEVRPNPRVPGWTRATSGDVTRLSGKGDGDVRLEVVNADLVRDGHVFKLVFPALAPDSIHALTYALVDSTQGDTLFKTGVDFAGAGSGPVGAGLLPIVRTPERVLVDPARTGFRPARADTNGDPLVLEIQAVYTDSKSRNLRRRGYPEDLRIVFYDTVADTSSPVVPLLTRFPVRFKIFAVSDTGVRQLNFSFRDGKPANDSTRVAPDSTFADSVDVLGVLEDSGPPAPVNVMWTFSLLRKPKFKPTAGDTFDLKLLVPFGPEDSFAFTTTGSSVDPALAQAQFAEKPYVVPNPYVGSASFEPARFAVSGRGERRIEFRAIPQGAVVRIYTVRGDLVQTLRHDGSDTGVVAWNLRTKDNLDLAPGLYVFHVAGRGIGEHVGKFAVVK